MTTSNDSTDSDDLYDLLNAFLAGHNITLPGTEPLLDQHTTIETTNQIGAIPAGTTGIIVDVRPNDDKGRVYTVKLDVAKYGLTSNYPVPRQHPDELILSVTLDVRREDVVQNKTSSNSN